MKNQRLAKAVIISMLVCSMGIGETMTLSKIPSVEGKTKAPVMAMVGEKESVDGTTSTNQKITSVKVKTKKSRRKYKTKSGVVLVDYAYERPVLEGDTKAIKKINQVLVEAEKQYYIQAKKIRTEASFLYREMKKKDFKPYTDDVFTTISYNNNGMISIVQDGYVYCGGAHGTPTREVYVYDLNSGKQLKVTDLFKGSQKSIKTRIEKEYNTTFKDMDGVFDDAKSIVKNTKLSDYHFYLDEYGVTFYYEPTTLCCYAAGYVEARIFYADNKSAFKRVI